MFMLFGTLGDTWQNKCKYNRCAPQYYLEPRCQKMVCWYISPRPDRFYKKPRSLYCVPQQKKKESVIAENEKRRCRHEKGILRSCHRTCRFVLHWDRSRGWGQPTPEIICCARYTLDGSRDDNQKHLPCSPPPPPPPPLKSEIIPSSFGLHPHPGEQDLVVLRPLARRSRSRRPDQRPPTSGAAAARHRHAPVSGLRQGEMAPRRRENAKIGASV